MINVLKSFKTVLLFARFKVITVIYNNKRDKFPTGTRATVGQLTAMAECSVNKNLLPS